MNLRTITLTESQRIALEQGYKKDKNSSFRQRCHLVLLKSTGRTSADVGSILGMNEISVNSWLNRYESEGIEGLRTKPGRGPKPILDEKSDAELVKSLVLAECQRLKLAKQEIEVALGKKFSLQTLKRFLKNLSASGSE